MGMPAAKMGDHIVATDIHIILVITPGGIVPTPLPHPFNGIINSGCSTDVNIMSMGAAVMGSEAMNTPPHIPQGGMFQKPPSNKGKIIRGSATVMINGKPAARLGDTAMTCNDPADLPIGTVIAAGTVMIGG
ncbi:MAG: hypothetical protein GWO41_12275 [candidate division Zixibacteria bacterium]|nr:hypothetical protein [candidate division Zixibacteria bacterium]NIR66043.1 hypothetical protein [candidate division Zixibacteria bacterium]NIS17127.1 hypothetical protein [candidate division Zixibacteria bacterium]NIS47673.1 hypothetical protein [candidate division Zixibacteria bacterium]NIT53482.1 hypothetical protein [candidate division Zixibacteria bacterium]